MTGVTARLSQHVIARYRPVLWLLGPIAFVGIGAALAFTPYVLGYDSASTFIAEHRRGLSWAITAVIGCPIALGIALALLIAPFRSQGAAIRMAGDALIFTGPFDWSIPINRVQDIDAPEGKGTLVILDTRGQSRTIGVLLYDASATELRRRILAELGRVTIGQ